MSAVRKVEAFALLPYQHRPAIYVKYLSGNKASMISAEKQNARRNLLGLGRPAERDDRKDGPTSFCVVQRSRRHVGIYPPRRPRVYIYGMASYLRRTALDHPDTRTVLFPQFFDQPFRLRLGFFVIEHDASPSRHEHPDRRRANAA